MSMQQYSQTLNKWDNPIYLVVRNKYLFRRILKSHHIYMKRKRINKRGYDGWNDYMEMVRHGHFGLLIEKIDRNLIYYTPPVVKGSIEMMCCSIQHLWLFHRFYKSCQEYFTDDNALIWAARNKNIDIFRTLYHQSEPVDLYESIMDRNKSSKVVEEAIIHKNFELVDYMLDNNICIKKNSNNLKEYLFTYSAETANIRLFDKLVNVFPDYLSTSQILDSKWQYQLISGKASYVSNTTLISKVQAFSYISLYLGNIFENVLKYPITDAHLDRFSDMAKHLFNIDIKLESTRKETVDLINSLSITNQCNNNNNNNTIRDLENVIVIIKVIKKAMPALGNFGELKMLLKGLITLDRYQYGDGKLTKFIIDLSITSIPFDQLCWYGSENQLREALNYIGTRKYLVNEYSLVALAARVDTITPIIASIPFEGWDIDHEIVKLF